MKRLPYVTITLAMCALLIHLAGWDQAMQWSRQHGGGFVGGLVHLLSVFTSHFTHWNTTHLFWNGLTFVVLGAMIEQHSRTALWTCVTLCAVTIITAVQWWSPELATYRGLSGIDSALFVLTACLMIFNAKNRFAMWLPALAMAAFAGKSFYEWRTGQLLFVAPEGFLPCPLAHVVGGVTGLAVAIGWLVIRQIRYQLILLARGISFGMTHKPRPQRLGRA